MVQRHGYQVQHRQSNGLLPRKLRSSGSSSLDNGATWQQIGTGFVTGSSIEWNVPFVAGQKDQCLVMVIGYDSSERIVGGDSSDGLFTIDGQNLSILMAEKPS